LHYRCGSRISSEQGNFRFTYPDRGLSLAGIGPVPGGITLFNLKPIRTGKEILRGCEAGDAAYDRPVLPVEAVAKHIVSTSAAGPRPSKT